MKLLIVDDDQLICDGLSIILNSEDDIDVIGIARNGQEAFDMCKTHGPDIVLMDIRMPKVDGIKGVKMIKNEFPQVRVLMLTTFQDDEYIKEAIKNGAQGYLLKNQGADVIIDSIRAAYKGTFICEKGVISSLTEMIGDSPYSEQDLKKYDINQREFQVLSLISQGMNNKEISEQLYIGQGTVRNYVTSLLDKLELRDRTQLAIFYLKQEKRLRRDIPTGNISTAGKSL